MNANQKIMEEAEQFVQEHLVECCQEVIKWHASTSLEDGRVRQLINILQELDAHVSIGLAECLIQKAAMAKVADLNKAEPM